MKRITAVFLLLLSLFLVGCGADISAYQDREILVVGEAHRDPLHRQRVKTAGCLPAAHARGDPRRQLRKLGAHGDENRVRPSGERAVNGQKSCIICHF